VLIVEEGEVGSMMEWQSVSSSDGNHIASTVTSMLEVPLDAMTLLFSCLQMLYLIVFLRFSDRTLRL
jgi:hypothetical protein